MKYVEITSVKDIEEIETSTCDCTDCVELRAEIKTAKPLLLQALAAVADFNKLPNIHNTVGRA